MVPLVVSVVEVVDGWSLFLLPFLFLFAQVGRGHRGGLLDGVLFYVLQVAEIQGWHHLFSGRVAA